MKVHFIGIGGAGQRAVAEFLLSRGDEVSGSDVQTSTGLDDLRSKGATIFLGHSAENIAGSELVVVSSAVPANNPEVVQALARDIPVIKNADMLSRLTQGKRSVAIAGTHGKTTTSSLITWMVYSAGLEPSFVVGGEVRNLSSSGRIGSGDLFVVEADEYDRRFLALTPEIAVVTNIEVDHLDYFGSEEAMRDAFHQFADSLPSDGLLVACAEDSGCRGLLGRYRGPSETYSLGTSEASDWRARNIILDPTGTSFDAWRRGTRVGHFDLSLFGRHNVLNALAAVAVGCHLGIDSRSIREGLASFQGARRRFEFLGERAGVCVMIDYGHLPAEIVATIAAARQMRPVRLVVCFQPHTYARTRLLMNDFASAFDGTDQTVIVRTYVPPGREMPEVDATAEELARKVASRNERAAYARSVDALVDLLVPELRSGDLVLLMGAGDIAEAGNPLLQRLALANSGSGGQ